MISHTATEHGHRSTASTENHWLGVVSIPSVAALARFTFGLAFRWQVEMVPGFGN